MKLSAENNLDNEYQYALKWLEQGGSVVIATVIETWGSSPRPTGSHMVINEESDFVGSVSGGCIEGAVITEAMELFQTGGVKTLDFSVSKDEAWEVGLSCGGTIKVFIQKFSCPRIVGELLDYINTPKSFSLITDLSSGDVWFDLGGRLEDDRPAFPVSSVMKVIRSVELKNESRIVQADGRSFFVRNFSPAIKLVIIGAVHISKALCQVAAVLEFDVLVIDPREFFAKREQFSQFEVLNQWPDDVLSSSDLHSGSAVVTLTHDPKIDDVALEIALDSNAFYIGALGSRKTHEARVERLSERGYKNKLSRIKAPIGLDLGGRKPEEIAVSIMAEILQTRYK